MKTYPFPQQIEHLICSDLDETFLPFDDHKKSISGISTLEKLFMENMAKHPLIFGWITGSNLSAALAKTKDYITYLPHFIASSLGSEFYWIEDGEPVEPLAWKQLIEQSNYRKDNITEIMEKLHKKGIALISQSPDYQGKYKSAFYYRIKPSQVEDFEHMQQLASAYSCKVMMNRSNPAAGDPANCYDIEFIPQCCGKGEVVDFLKKELHIATENCYAFGDSFNDFSMFSRVKHAFLVGNADPLAKMNHPEVLSENYCFGIATKLNELLFSRSE